MLRAFQRPRSGHQPYVATALKRRGPADRRAPASKPFPSVQDARVLELCRESWPSPTVQNWPVPSRRFRAAAHAETVNNFKPTLLAGLTSSALLLVLSACRGKTQASYPSEHAGSRSDRQDRRAEPVYRCGISVRFSTWRVMKDLKVNVAITRTKKHRFLVAELRPGLRICLKLSLSWKVRV